MARQQFKKRKGASGQKPSGKAKCRGRKTEPQQKPNSKTLELRSDGHSTVSPTRVSAMPDDFEPEVLRNDTEPSLDDPDNNDSDVEEVEVEPVPAHRRRVFATKAALAGLGNVSLYTQSFKWKQEIVLVVANASKSEIKKRSQRSKWYNGDAAAKRHTELSVGIFTEGHGKKLDHKMLVLFKGDDSALIVNVFSDRDHSDKEYGLSNHCIRLALNGEGDMFEQIWRSVA